MGRGWGAVGWGGGYRIPCIKMGNGVSHFNFTVTMFILIFIYFLNCNSEGQSQNYTVHKTEDFARKENRSGLEPTSVCSPATRRLTRRAKPAHTLFQSCLSLCTVPRWFYLVVITASGLVSR